jgi:hypothetical protein
LSTADGRVAVERGCRAAGPAAKTSGLYLTAGYEKR